MKFKLDENLSGKGVQILRAAGHDAVTVLDQGLGGKPDPEIFAVVQAEARALITLDVGFANIRTYSPGSSAGTFRDDIDEALFASLRRLRWVGGVPASTSDEN